MKNKILIWGLIVIGATQSICANETKYIIPQRRGPVGHGSKYALTLENEDSTCPRRVARKAIRLANTYLTCAHWDIN